MTEDKAKDNYFRFRIDTKTKKDFQQLTKTKAINTSELLRHWIEDYIRNNS